MANFSALKTAIQNAIKQNGNEEITGDVLQQILLSIVSTMGDGAINTIEQNLSSETLARQGADNTLQSNIDAEALARGNADTQLQNAINAIKANIDNGYVYGGIATPSSTPVSGKVFYIATAAGTYTNFGGQVLTQGINILRFNGSAWSHQQLIGIDDEPTAGSNSLVKSGTVDKAINLLGMTLINGILNNALVRNYWRDVENGTHYLSLKDQYVSRASFKFPIPAGTLVLRGNVSRSAGPVFDEFVGEIDNKIYVKYHTGATGESTTSTYYDSESNTTTIELYGKPIMLMLRNASSSTAELNTEVLSFIPRNARSFLDQMTTYAGIGLIDKLFANKTMTFTKENPSDTTGKLVISSMSSNATRYTNVFPVKAGTFKFSGNLSVSVCYQILDVTELSDIGVVYTAQSLSGSNYDVEYDEAQGTTIITVVSQMHIILYLRDAQSSSAEINTQLLSYMPADENVNKINSNAGLYHSNFTIGSYTERDSNNIVRYKKYTIRFSNIFPLKGGVYQFEGNLRVTACSQVKRIINCTNDYREFEVGVSLPRTVEYDELSNVTKITVDTDYPFIISIGNIDNSIISNIGFISYEPLMQSPTYHVPVRMVNPCENSDTIKYFGECVIVSAGDDAVVIAGYCGVERSGEQVFNSYSLDGGVTWHTSWTTGKFSMTWDRVNERLCAMWGGKAYASTDYGVTWSEIGNAPTQVTPAMEALCLQYKQAEKAAYEADPTINRYAYNVYAVNTQNPGIQLENGVICMPMLIRIKKTDAGNVNKGDTPPQGSTVDSNGWIVDGNGYPVPINSTSVGLGSTAAYVAYSKDYGVTWQNSPSTPAGIVNEELCVVEAAPNQLCLNARGGTENYWESVENTIRHMYFQHTPVDSREDFVIDSWDADYGTRPTNTIPDSLVNAGICKVKGFVPAGSNAQSVDFWLFSNICNPGSAIRVNQTLRISADCKNWIVVDSLSPSNKPIGGYVGVASDGSNIYLVMEQNRNKEGDHLLFCRLDSGEFIGKILTAFETANKYF